jgi:hypothetical protein
MTLNDESLSNQACTQIINDCLLSGYNFIFDAHGNIAFTSLSKFSSCDSFYAAAFGNEYSGTIQAISLSGNVHFEAFYEDLIMHVPISSLNCTLKFNLETYFPNDMSGSISFEGTNGDSSCHVTECEEAGYNYIIDSSNAILFANRGSSFCPITLGHIDNIHGMELMTTVDRLQTTDISSHVSSVLTMDQIIVTLDETCVITFSRTLSTSTIFSAQGQGAFMSNGFHYTLVFVVFVLMGM